MAVPQLQLSNGAQIPQVGLGLWQVTDPEEFSTMLKAALAAGYRHFDTAQAYHNEQFLGEALRRSDIARKEVFITTKVLSQRFFYKQVKDDFAESLRRLQTDYVDLLLLHFPVPILRKQAWHAVEEIHAAGHAKSIGVSNYTIRHLEQMKKYAKVMPAVNQIEQHVFLQQPDLIRYCQDNNILVEAYSPLAHASSLDNDAIKQIASKHNKTYAQVMLRWLVQNGYVVLPKSKTPSRLKENIDIFNFELDSDDMQQLTVQNRNLHTCAPTKSAPFMP